MRGFGLFRNLFRTEVRKQPTDRRQEPRVDAREGLRILVVDDSPTVVAVLGRMLTQARYEPYAVDSGEAALESLNERIPDLVFLDIVLPGMSGFAVLRALRRDPRTANVPVIMISGNLKATEEFYGQRIGADDFMKKPFGRSEVFSRIQRLVEKGRLPPREIRLGLEPAAEEDPGVEETVPADSEVQGDVPVSVEPGPAPERVAAQAASTATLAAQVAAALGAGLRVTPEAPGRGGEAGTVHASGAAPSTMALWSAPASTGDTPYLGAPGYGLPPLLQRGGDDTAEAPATGTPAGAGPADGTPDQPDTAPPDSPQAQGSEAGGQDRPPEATGGTAPDGGTGTAAADDATAGSPARDSHAAEGTGDGNGAAPDGTTPLVLPEEWANVHPALWPEYRDPDSKIIHEPPWERD